MCVRPTSPSDRPVLTRRPTAPHPELRRLLGGSRRWPATTCPSSRVRPDAPAARTARAARVAFRRSVSFSHCATRQAQVGRRFRARHDPTWMPTSDNWQEESAFPFLALSGVSFRPVFTKKKIARSVLFFSENFFSRSRRAIRRALLRALFRVSAPAKPPHLPRTFEQPEKSRRGGKADPHAAVAHGEETPQREGPHGRGRV